MSKSELKQPKDQITEMIKPIYRAGLTTTSGGNISIKVHAGNIWITPAAIDKGSLTRKDIMCVRSSTGYFCRTFLLSLMENNLQEKKLSRSSSSKVHLR